MAGLTQAKVSTVIDYAQIIFLACLTAEITAPPCRKLRFVSKVLELLLADLFKFDVVPVPNRFYGLVDESVPDCQHRKGNKHLIKGCLLYLLLPK